MVVNPWCHLQLNRGAAHLETDFAVNSRSRVPVLQLSRGAMASHFCHWHVPLSHTLERTARPDLPRIWLVRRFGACAGPRAFPKGTLHLNSGANRVPICSAI